MAVPVVFSEDDLHHSIGPRFLANLVRHVSPSLQLQVGFPLVSSAARLPLIVLVYRGNVTPRLVDLEPAGAKQVLQRCFAVAEHVALLIVRPTDQPTELTYMDVHDISQRFGVTAMEFQVSRASLDLLPVLCNERSIGKLRRCFSDKGYALSHQPPFYVQPYAPQSSTPTPQPAPQQPAGYMHGTTSVHVPPQQGSISSDGFDMKHVVQVGLAIVFCVLLIALGMVTWRKESGSKLTTAIEGVQLVNDALVGGFHNVTTLVSGSENRMMQNITDTGELIVTEMRKDMTELEKHMNGTRNALENQLTSLHSNMSQLDGKVNRILAALETLKPLLQLSEQIKQLVQDALAHDKLTLAMTTALADPTVQTKFAQLLRQLLTNSSLLPLPPPTPPQPQPPQPQPPQPPQPQPSCPNPIDINELMTRIFAEIRKNLPTQPSTIAPQPTSSLSADPLLLQRLDVLESLCKVMAAMMCAMVAWSMLDLPLLAGRWRMLRAWAKRRAAGKAKVDRDEVDEATMKQLQHLLRLVQQNGAQLQQAAVHEEQRSSFQRDPHVTQRHRGGQQ